MHRGGVAVVVLLLRDLHVVEGGERGDHGPPDPRGTLALGVRVHRHRLRPPRAGRDLVLQAVAEA